MFSQFKENMEINQGIHGPNQIKRENLKRIGQMIHTKKNIVQRTAQKEPKCQDMLFLKTGWKERKYKKNSPKTKKRDQREIINLIHWKLTQKLLLIGTFQPCRIWRPSAEANERWRPPRRRLCRPPLSPVSSLHWGTAIDWEHSQKGINVDSVSWCICLSEAISFSQPRVPNAI